MRIADAPSGNQCLHKISLERRDVLPVTHGFGNELGALLKSPDGRFYSAQAELEEAKNPGATSRQGGTVPHRPSHGHGPVDTLATVRVPPLDRRELR